MDVLVTLLIAHFIADFPLQTNQIFTWKNKGGVGILPHVLVHMGVTALLMQRPLENIPLLLCLGAAHYVVDWFKVNYPTDEVSHGFLMDQVAHVLVLVGFALWMPAFTPRLMTSFQFPVLVACLLPAFLMFIWVRNMSSPQDVAQMNLKTLSQLAGLVVVLGVIAML
jgi:hypothetical protein